MSKQHDEGEVQMCVCVFRSVRMFINNLMDKYICCVCWLVELLHLTARANNCVAEESSESGDKTNKRANKLD